MEVSGCGADSADEGGAAAAAEVAVADDVPAAGFDDLPVEAAPAQRKRRSSDIRSPPVSKDIRACLVQGNTTAVSSWEEGEGIVGMREPSFGGGGEAASGAEAVLGAFKLVASEMQQHEGDALMGKPSGCGDGLVISVLQKPSSITNIRQAVTLLFASTPLQPSGEAIFSQLPPMWLKFSGRNDALGLRCLFTSRRHEHSVFTPLLPESFLQVPEAVKDWQPAIVVPANTVDTTGLADEDPWVADVHAGDRCLRIMLRPGVLLLRMLQRGTALPAANFTWRVVDTSAETTWAGRSADRPNTAHRLGEFSILSNLEDAAHPQPPRFHDFPLRREQLRSLGWMVSQERRRREPFSVELKDGVPFVDAQHWRLEGCLRCEYGGVKGGVLADAIGYGKTACTIGLIDCTKADQLPQVPRPFAGFIPSRATLVLAPTNLHSQWLCEIVKFTGQTLKVLSVPTCTQLKHLTAAELAAADVVVATYRLFYSTPYLRRLEELAQTKQPNFHMPTSGKGHSGKTQSMPEEWARAYRRAFELLPSCTGAMEMYQEATPKNPNGGEQPAAMQEQGGKRRPGRPMKSARGAAPVPPPPEATGELAVSTQLYSGEALAESLAAAADSSALDGGASQADAAGKRRRLIGKQTSSHTQEAPPQAAEEAPPTPGPVGLGQATVPDLQFVPLEAFWWRRVVCDEFHELLNRYPPAQVAIKLFHADYKWGLSGTPPCETLAQIRKAAGFLGVQLPLNDGGGKTDSAAEAPRRVAQEWLDAFARRNTSELPPLDEEEQIVLVKQSPKERALYMALTGEQDTMGGPVPEDEKEGAAPGTRGVRCNSTGLLKLCSHFAPGGANVLTAEDECERQLGMRKAQVRSIERQARSLAERAATTAELVRAFEPHFCRVPLEEDFAYIRKEPKQAIAARLAVLGASTSGTKPVLLARLFSEAATAGEDKKALALSMDFKADADNPTGDGTSGQGAPDMAKWLALRKKAFVEPSTLEDAGKALKLLLRNARAAISAVEKGTGAVPPARCVSLRMKLGMPRWPNSTEKEAAAASSRAWKTFQEEDLAWRRNPKNCANLQKVITAWKEDMEFCADRIVALEEEAELKLHNLATFQQHTASASSCPQDGMVTMQEPTRKFAKYGSKIQAIVKHVQKLKAQEPGCKVICFVQWEDLKRKIASALEEFSLGHLTLHGSVWARRAALNKFQYEVGGPQMLLLSLEESASGTNLTAANHVIIVHPMHANTREEAVAFEMQAVGRVRRPGQQRKIHVWRFVTVGTIEQQITEEHQQELWERQRDKVPVPEGPQDIPTESEPEDGDLMEVDGGEAEPLPPAPVLEDELLATQPYLPGVADVATPFRALQRSGGAGAGAAASSSGVAGAGASSSKEGTSAAAAARAARGRSRSRASKPGKATPGKDKKTKAPSKSPGSGAGRRSAAAPPAGESEGAQAVMEGQDCETLPYGDVVRGHSTRAADFAHLIPETQDYGIQDAEGFAAGVAAAQVKEAQPEQGEQDDMDPPWGKVSEEEEEAAMPWARIDAGKAQDAAANPTMAVKGIESLPETLQWDDVEADTVPATAAYPEEDRVWMNPPGQAKHIIQDDSIGCLAATQYYEDMDATQRYP